jgi:non-homologous end joining protein Ku
MRTHVSKAQVVFTLPLNGVLTQLAIPGAIYSTVKGTTDKSLSSVCPTHDALIRYDVFCPEGCGPIDRAHLRKGKVVDEKLVIVDDAEEIRESTIARGKLSVSVVDRQSFLDGTIPNGQAYHFMPMPGDTQEREAYAILYSAITDNPDLAFVCRANIGRGAETLVSLESGAFGGLTLQTLAYPETLYDLPEYEVEPLSKPMKANVRALLDSQVSTFDADQWLDQQAAAVREAVAEAAKAPNRKGVAKQKKVKESSVGLLNAIAAAAKAS